MKVEFGANSAGAEVVVSFSPKETRLVELSEAWLRCLLNREQRPEP